MRRFLVVCSVVVSFGVAACGSCSDSNKVGHLPDAPPVPDDAPPDSPPEMPKPVTLTVTRDGLPLGDRPVYFLQPDSTLVLATKTDAEGKASAIVRSGGSVTVIESVQITGGGSASERPPGSDYQLTTFAGVKEGDDLHLDLGSPPPPQAVTFDLTVPDEVLGRTYLLYPSCGDAGQVIGTGVRPEVRAGRSGIRAGSGETPTVNHPVTLTGCGGTADLLVVATEDQSESDAVVVSWLYKPNMAVAEGVPIVLSDAYTDVADVDFSYDHVSPLTDHLQVQRELRSPRGSLFFTNTANAIPEPDMTASVSIAAPGPATLQAITTTTDVPVAKFGQHTILEWGTAGGYSLDYSSVALHGYDTAPDVDRDHDAIVWTEAAGGAAPDFVLGSFRGQRSMEAGTDIWIWRIAAPYVPPYLTDEQKLSYPALPTTIFDFSPGAEDSVGIQRLTTVKVPGGYDKVRAHAFNPEALNAITGATGRIVFEDMFEPPPPPALTSRAAAAPPARSTLPARFTPRAH